MRKMLFIYVTCKNASEAEKIGEMLVKKRLVACAVVVPKAKSIFRWNGKIVKASESLLFLKSAARNKAKLEAEVKKLHSYEVPCIVFFNARGSADYEKWVERA